MVVLPCCSVLLCIMPIRIQWQNGSLVAECDTAAEAAEFMRAAQNGSASSPTDKYERSNDNHAKSHVPHSPQTDLVSLIHLQTANVQQLLKSLYLAGREIKAEDLAQASGIHKNKFGGLFGAVSKAADKANLPMSSIYKKDVRFNGPRREVWYAPGKALREHGGAAFNG